MTPIINLVTIDFEPLWIWIVSQAVGLAAIVLMFIALQQKTKSRQLAWSLAFNTLLLIANLLLRNYVVVGSLAVMLINNCVFVLIARNQDGISKRKIPDWFRWAAFSFFSTLNIVVTVLLWHFDFAAYHWFYWLIIVTVTAINLGKAVRGVHFLKITLFSAQIIFAINAIMFWNLMGVITSAVVSVSIIFFYVKYFRKRKNNVAVDDDITE